ncbi:uncharacterized protein LOC143240506 [Tachypleus tridentatus]|uniref:uncharacterized protein LOC143240506 n=1 Tax=Tachypleus tridentatus TaxID=6853 RepID=UPI003FD19D9C
MTYAKEKENEDKYKTDKFGGSLNVIINGIDSISNLNSLRYFTKTHVPSKCMKSLLTKRKEYSGRGYCTLFTEDMSKDDKKYFLFLFIARLTHNVLNYEGYADYPSYDILQCLHNSGTLNRTIIIFLSDHGIRFVKIRTLLGEIKERKLFVFFTIP